MIRVSVWRRLGLAALALAVPLLFLSCNDEGTGWSPPTQIGLRIVTTTPAPTPSPSPPPQPVETATPEPTPVPNLCPENPWAYCAVLPGKELYFVYFEKGCPRAEITGARPNTAYRGHWFDPRNGMWLKDVALLYADSEGILTLPVFPEGREMSQTDWAMKVKFDR